MSAALGGTNHGAAQNVERAEAIPEWKLEARVPSLNSLDKLAIASAHADELLKQQQQQQPLCPHQVQLTQRLSLQPGYAMLLGQTGAWHAEPSEVVLASWAQSFLTRYWQTADIVLRDLDGHDAFRAEAISEAMLKDRYDWMLGPEPDSYAGISQLQSPWEQAAYLARLRGRAADNDAVVISTLLQTQNSSAEVSTVALLNCRGDLLFVVRLSSHVRQFPGGIDVYDRAGYLVAHSLTDVTVPRHQFVDIHGNLLATAEAPSLDQGISLLDLPRDPARGKVLTYELKYEEGGYEGASKLLAPSLRWILAMAVQLRAVHDGRLTSAPDLPRMLPTLYWITALLFVVIVVTFCFLSARGSQRKGLAVA